MTIQPYTITSYSGPETTMYEAVYISHDMTIQPYTITIGYVIHFFVC